MLKCELGTDTPSSEFLLIAEDLGMGLKPFIDSKESWRVWVKASPAARLTFFTLLSLGLQKNNIRSFLYLHCSPALRSKPGFTLNLHKEIPALPSLVGFLPAAGLNISSPFIFWGAWISCPWKGSSSQCMALYHLDNSSVHSLCLIKRAFLFLLLHPHTQST